MSEPVTTAFDSQDGAPPGPPASRGIAFHIDAATKFHRSAIFKGCFRHRTGNKPVIKYVTVTSQNVLAATWLFIRDMPHLGDHAGGFEIQCLLANDAFPVDLELIFDIENVGAVRLTWEDISRKMLEDDRSGALYGRFCQILRDSEGAHMLDIGGRARSGVLRANDFPGVKTEVLDILPGDGVTVVCDAHRMSTVLEHDRFDAVLSVSVFEHLVMPWKVAVEMNRVMKTGAIGLIHSHQTIGMHDLPWDFFRFSDSAWKGIFNSHTGFEILATSLGGIHYIIPHRWSERYRDAEKTGGFESSTVLVRKISPSVVDWPLSAEQVTTDAYPPGTTVAV